MYYVHKRDFVEIVTLHVMNAEYPWLYSHPKIRLLGTLTSVALNQSPRRRVTKYFRIHYYDSNKTRSHNA